MQASRAILRAWVSPDMKKVKQLLEVRLKFVCLWCLFLSIPMWRCVCFKEKDILLQKKTYKIYNFNHLEAYNSVTLSMRMKL